ncbi:MAG: hypothetical protein ACRERX_05500 [Pseudomonas sp.]
MVLALLVGAAGVLLALLNALDVLNARLAFVAHTGLLLVYLWLEVSRLRRVHPERWLLNPVALCSFMTFVMGYGVTNGLFFLPEKELELVGLVPEVTPAMAKLMCLVLLGAVAMWLGYWSPIAARLSNLDSATRFQVRLLPKTNCLRSLALPSLLAVSLTARLMQIQLGVFGYSATYDQLISMGSVTQYLFIGSELGKLALVLVALQFYERRTSLHAKLWFYGLLASEVAFGFLSGFKSAVVIPFVIAAFCQYLRTGRFSKQWLMIALAGAMAAYAVIEPFRAARNENSAFRGTSLDSIISTMIGAAGSTGGDLIEQGSALLAFASRSNLSYVAALGIDFADDNPSLPDGSPEFLANLFLAPLHAWIPRLVWENKPLGTLGLWYNQVVMGMTHFSSTAMGPFTYLYFAGGFVAVLIGFFFVGVVQRTLFFLLQPASSMAGGTVFLTILNTVVAIDSSFDSIIISLCRNLPLILFVQFLLFRGHYKNYAMYQLKGARIAEQ